MNFFLAKSFIDKYYIWESKKKNLNASITKKTLEFLQKLKDSGHWNDNNDYSEVDSYPPGVDVIDSFAIYYEEKKCVKDFYLKHIEPSKGVKTDTKEVATNNI